MTRDDLEAGLGGLSSARTVHAETQRSADVVSVMNGAEAHRGLGRGSARGAAGRHLGILRIEWCVAGTVERHEQSSRYRVSARSLTSVQHEKEARQ